MSKRGKSDAEKLKEKVENILDAGYTMINDAIDTSPVPTNFPSYQSAEYKPGEKIQTIKSPGSAIDRIYSLFGIKRSTEKDSDSDSENKTAASNSVTPNPTSTTQKNY